MCRAAVPVSSSFGPISRLNLHYHLRAQIRLTSDVSGGIERTLNLVDAEAVGSGRHAEVTGR
jgi:hypothetical protein